MKRALLIGSLCTFVAAFATRTAHSALQSVRKDLIVAEAVIGAPSTLIISASTLPTAGFFGKNVVIPVTVTTSNGGPINTSGLRVDLAYQNVDAAGQPLGT